MNHLKIKYMQIIKDKTLINNEWTFVSDDDIVSDSGNITVSLSRWIDQQNQLRGRSGKTGIRLTPSDDTGKLAAILSGIELIELYFPNFGDGRHFSHARLLRNRLGFQGEIRAVGNFLPDQIYFMSRVGINAFQLDDHHSNEDATNYLDDFSVNYQ